MRVWRKKKRRGKTQRSWIEEKEAAKKSRWRDEEKMKS